MPTALRVIIYPVFAVFCVLVFSILLFPFDSVKNRVSAELEEALGGDYAITIQDLSPSFLSGVVLKDVEIRPRGIPDAQPVKLSRAKLKFAILPLFSGATEVDFDLRAGHGKAVGAFSWRRGGMELDLKMDRYDLSVTQILSQRVGIPISGIMSGTVDLELYPQDPLRNAGQIVLNILEMKIGPLNLGGGIVETPPIHLTPAAASPSRIEVVVNRGNFEVKTVQFTGGDMELQANGKIYGARQMDNYRFNLKGNVKISKELADKIPFLLALEKQKTPEGAFPFTITGRISKPSLRIGDFKVPI